MKFSTAIMVFPGSNFTLDHRPETYFGGQKDRFFTKFLEKNILNLEFSIVKLSINVFCFSFKGIYDWEYKKVVTCLKRRFKTLQGSHDNDPAGFKWPFKNSSLPFNSLIKKIKQFQKPKA